MKIKPANSPYTNDQWQAIHQTGRDLLLSASAGSGKTMVLVERILTQLLSGASIDRFLVVTFTEAAAKEMKERLTSGIQKAVARETDFELRQHLLRQLTLIPSANISTLHAFCLKVIQQYSYLIELNPVFRLMADETENELLMEDVFAEVRERFYQEGPKTFIQLVDNFSNDRTDDAFQATCFELFQFMRSAPEPFAWLKESFRWYGAGEIDLLYQQQLAPLVNDFLQEARQMYQELIQQTEPFMEMDKIRLLLQTEADYLGGALAAGSASYEKSRLLLQEMEFPRFPQLRKKTDSEEAKELAKSLSKARAAIKKDYQAMLADYFSYPAAELIDYNKKAAPLLATLAEFMETFAAELAARKAKKNVLDFNDLEHFALEILRTKGENGQFGPSAASLAFREQFTEVLVDEYQDLNQLQEAILFWLRRVPETNDAPGNYFMVGDVKQSIYGFRRADPELFINKFHAFENHQGGERIILAENFRSRPEVLNFTNLVFQQLMDASVGQIDYDQEAFLKLGNKNFPESPNFTPEVLIYEKKSVIDPEKAPLDFEDRSEGELSAILLKIRELVESGFEIYDKKAEANRPIRFSDIVLLSSTRKFHLKAVELFEQFQVPLVVQQAENYFQAMEVRQMLALLEVIDNPKQDIALATVLKSPLVGLSENELVKIRTSAPQSDFYSAFETYLGQSKERTSERQQAELFAERLTRWRRINGQLNLVELIWDIYETTGFLDYVGGLPAGAQRQANLHALYQRANQYEATSYRGLFAFVRFIRKMQEKDKDLSEPAVLEKENAVRLMTIHGSKGLEFPVVFLFDLSHQFNLGELKKRMIMDAHAGVGMKFLLSATREVVPTFAYIVLKARKKQVLLAEEIRKLYVALTRAEQKLYLVGSYDNEPQLWNDWERGAVEKEVPRLSATLRLGAANFMSWIGYTLIRHPKSLKYAPTAGNTLAALASYGTYELHFYSKEALARELNRLSARPEETPPAASGAAAALWPRAKERLEAQYPFEKATITTSYQSVSELKRRYEDPDTGNMNDLSDMPEAHKLEARGYRPRFAEESLGTPRFLEEDHQPAATEIGTATHFFLQRLPLFGEYDLTKMQRFAASLVQEGVLEEALAKRIPYDKILHFFHDTAFGREMLQAKSVQRERTFAMLLPAVEIFSGYPNTPRTRQDKVLIHGILDGYFAGPGAIMLFDYKTDHLPQGGNAEEVEKLKKRYGGQLRLYREALASEFPQQAIRMFLIALDAADPVIELSGS